MNFISLLFGVFYFLNYAGHASAMEYPQSWTRFTVPVEDSRHHLPSGSPLHPHLEIAEIPYLAITPPAGALLMIPGFFQNGNSFDLLPEKGISFARYLSEKFKLRVYLLHIRGLGLASSGKKLNLDDFAIDDLPAAIDWVSKKEQSKIFVFGNSQGGIMLQASLSGLARCSASNCFSPEAAVSRQNEVRGMAISGGSVSMTHEKNAFFYPSLLSIYRLIGAPLRASPLDYINIFTLTQEPLLTPLAHFPLWSFLYLEKNTSREAQEAMFDRTLEATWAGVMLQFGNGIEKEGVRTEYNGQSGRPYTSGFKNLQVPTVQVTYEMDPFAEPEVTERDSYSFIGSPSKKFFTFPEQSHEDYLMSAKLHRDWDEPFEWLVQNSMRP